MNARPRFQRVEVDFKVIDWRGVGNGRVGNDECDKALFFATAIAGRLALGNDGLE